MQFIYPGFLFALPLVLIPLIIHLFRFRRYRKVYFTNVRFIADLKLETERKSRLKHILVLITRMLMLAMLVMAFAQPYLPIRESDKNLQAIRHVSMYIDNSFSMEAASEEGVLLESAKAKAAGIASAYDASDLFHLITNDLEGRHHRYLSREDFLNFLLDVEPSPVSLGLEDVIVRHKDLLGDGVAEADLYVISDFQLSLISEGSNWSDSGLFVFFVPMQPMAVNNVYIDSAWFASPVQLAGMQSTLIVRVRNSGSDDIQKLPLKLTLDGEQRSVAALDIPAGGMIEASMVFRPTSHGWFHGELEIVDFPITYDDKYFLSFKVRERIPVLSIFDENPGSYLKALFGTDSTMQYHQTQFMDLDYGSISSYDLLVLNGLNSLSSGLINVLTEYLEQGGSLAVFPGPKADIVEYNSLLGNLGMGRIKDLDTTQTRVSELDRQHPLLQEVFDQEVREGEGSRTDLPDIFAHYPIEVASLGGLEIIGSMQNGRAFMVAAVAGRGRAYLFTVPLDPAFSNLPRHAIIVPLLYQLALHSKPVQDLSNEIGTDNLLIIGGQRVGEEVIRLKNLMGGSELVPELRRRAGDVSLFLHGQVRVAGIYQVLGADKILALSAFNYSREESDLRYYSPEDLQALCLERGWKATQVLDASRQDTLQMVQDINKGIRFWKWFVLIAIILLAVESILLRFLK